MSASRAAIIILTSRCYVASGSANSAAAQARAAERSQPPVLKQLTIEELLNVDVTSRLTPLQFQEVRDAYDGELQHWFALGGRQRLSLGAQYRVSRDNTTPTMLLFFDPQDRTTDMASAFLQDEPPLPHDVVITAGAPITVGNGLDATTSGIELVARVQPPEWLRVTTAYTYLTKERTLDAGSCDPFGGANEGIDPHHQWRLEGRMNLPRRIELDAAALRYVSALPNPSTLAYTKASGRCAWRPAERLELALIGRDLLHDEDVEFVAPTSGRRTALERAAFTRATIGF